MPPLSGGAVTGGRAGLDERQVRWVAVIEWPVEDFVAPGEFVLTTGIGCDAEQLAQLAGEVAERRRGGAVRRGRRRRAVRRAARAASGAVADERGMPLVEMPWAIRFADVLRALIDRLLAARYAATMDPGDQLPAGFTDALLHRDGLRRRSPRRWRAWSSARCCCSTRAWP